MRYGIILSCCLLTTFLVAQTIPENPNVTDEEGRRQGTWTIFYNENWKITSDKDSAAYYRLITYEDNVPVGMVRDYYRSGQVERESTLLQDRPEEILDGEVTWYLEDGTKSNSRYYQDGRIANYNEAITWFKQVLEQTRAELGTNHPDYGHYLNIVAISNTKQGLYAEAEPYHMEALEVIEGSLGKEHPNYSTTLHNLAKLYHYQGLFEKAEKSYLQVKNLHEDVIGKDKADYPVVLNNLGALYYRQGRFEDVKPLFREVLEINARIVGKNHRNYATSLNNLAAVHTRLNELKEAIPLIRESLDVYEKTLGKKHVHYTVGLNNLANLNKQLGNFDESEAIYLECIALEKEVLGSSHPEHEITLKNLAQLYDGNGMYQKAEPYYLESLRILQHQIAINFTHLSEKEKASYLKTFNDRFEAFYSFVLRRISERPGIISDAYNLSLATKGLLFDRQQKIQNRISSSGDSTLIQLYGQWKTQREYLSSVYTQTTQARESAGIDLEQEEEKVNQLEKRLSARSTLFASETENQPILWEDVQRSLAANEAAIEIVRVRYFEKEFQDSVLYVAMVLTQATTGKPQLIVLPNGNEMESRYQAFYKNSIKYKLSNTRSYEDFWRPVQEKLKGIDRVYLSADGIYHSINILGLKNASTNQFIIEGMDVQQVASTRELVKKETIGGLNEHIKLMGFPLFTDEDTSLTGAMSGSLAALDEQPRNFLEGGHIPVLPGTKQEIANIGKLLADQGYEVEEFVLDEATESTIKSWKSPKVIHIATHGYFLENEAANLPIGFASGELDEHPLLRSGLLLANAKDAIQQGGDGVLTAYEAKGLHLDDTELVVLSACETGLGAVKNGEGVYGLQRAFQSAGASSILMSLWKVSDEATMELMFNFYKNWLVEKQSKQEAFRTAQKQLFRKYPHPYYWAAFVMIGK